MLPTAMIRLRNVFRKNIEPDRLQVYFIELLPRATTQSTVLYSHLNHTNVIIKTDTPTSAQHR